MKGRIVIEGHSQGIWRNVIFFVLTDARLFRPAKSASGGGGDNGGDNNGGGNNGGDNNGGDNNGSGGGSTSGPGRKACQKNGENVPHEKDCAKFYM